MVNSVCNLNYFLKTHRMPGLIELRVIHAGTNHIFAALSTFIDTVLQKSLEHEHHLCSSTTDLVRKIEGLPTSPGDVLIRVDVSDFYMSGTHESLADLATCGLFGPTRLAMRDAILFVLRHQLVRCKVTNRCLRVLLGSGMGMKASW